MSKVLDMWAGMTGTVLPYAATAAPDGWLICAGAVVARATYPNLFARIGTTFNTSGETAAQFRLPDLRGEFIRGVDAGRGVDPNRVMGTKQQATPITFDATSSNPTVDTLRGTPATIPGDPVTQDDYGGAGIAQTYTESGVLITNNGGSGRVLSITGARPRNVALNYIIKT